MNLEFNLNKEGDFVDEPAVKGSKGYLVDLFSNVCGVGCAMLTLGYLPAKPIIDGIKAKFYKSAFKKYLDSVID